jgi:PAS domain S-box-containing protein
MGDRRNAQIDASDEARIIVTIGWTLIAAMCVAMALLVALVPSAAARWLLFGGLQVFVGVVAIWAGRTAHLEFARYFLVVTLWFVVLVASWSGGGLRAPSFVALLFFIALASLLLGPRGAITSIAVAVATVIGFTWAEASRVLPEPSFTHSPWSRAVVFLLYAVQVGLVAALTVSELRRSRERALHEVAERRAAEEALAASEAHYRALSESSLDLIYVIDREARLTYVNPPAARALGGDPESLVGARLHEVFDRDLHARMQERLEQLFQGGEPLRTEEQYESPEGPRWLTTWFVPLRDDAGEVAEVLGVSRDISDLKLAQQQLAELNAELEQRVELRTRQLATANAELEAFAYSVSHDLRAPLRAMDGFSQALLEDEGAALSATGRHYLERVRGGAQRMGGLIDALLALSRLSRKTLELKTVELGRVALDVADRLRDAEPARQIVLRVEPGLTAMADEELVEIILGNLLGNAWKFTRCRPVGHVEVGVAEVGGVRAFYVRDDGAGFDQAQAGRLFQPFQRLHSEREYDGNGIGLATVRRAVSRLGGRCWAESGQTPGATFWFTLEAGRDAPPDGGAGPGLTESGLEAPAPAPASGPASVA